MNHLVGLVDIYLPQINIAAVILPRIARLGEMHGCMG